ncbi:hypothetical protein [Actinocorallia libanotica]|uniref:Uncharacterized protein n=1 Tax=Actinocorallia libanotica TaxID=46162 RepID=A0ABN1Q3B5_9ACTN
MKVIDNDPTRNGGSQGDLSNSGGTGARGEAQGVRDAYDRGGRK